ncbi:sugar transferase [Staphylococcus hominis]|uniref:sugar transferase n=1 Tax=Staphylococcus TaxID=1279 RepID=UPI0006B882DE|nr:MULTISPECIES: sugar transferase [Staphylococcus]OFM65743.1 UDP-phosphate galactose phosphotransferase [Staphylococcus sp. HMSC068D07]OFN10959.1 UDP-phosphate galactose phosphotransferase [Staphylococcus sp. HMSC058D09]OFR09021.1 UDP-phosphate galactose phosphotransferase [Staphylococcus sp. HMSC078E07]KPG89172.1 UDP-phosphate galactose phosphotransferase [Staphylococcus hominis]MCI2882142.1 sugar transferase [Staphylococcus hominis]
MNYKTHYKRAFDLTLSLVAMPIVGLVISGTSLLIKLDDNGSVFYKSYRLGKNKSKFLMYKFRSMKMNAPDIRNQDGSTYNSENDSRITRVGKILRKTSIDEIPQLINVIKGDMSIVGPRPDTPEALEIYKNDESRKLEVKPGITGYNQAFFRNSIPQVYKFKNDVYYVDNVSFKFDCIIIWKTILSVLKRSNINNKES